MLSPGSGSASSVHSGFPRALLFLTGIRTLLLSLDTFRWFLLSFGYLNYEVREIPHIRRKRKLAFVFVLVIC